eukprot:g21801.t1
MEKGKERDTISSAHRAFCHLDSAGDNLFPQFDLAEMLFGNAFAFPGLTLVADDHPMEQLLKMSEKLQEQFPRASDIEADIKKQEESASKERRATRLSQRLNV